MVSAQAFCLKKVLFEAILRLTLLPLELLPLETAAMNSYLSFGAATEKQAAAFRVIELTAQPAMTLLVAAE